MHRKSNNKPSIPKKMDDSQRNQSNTDKVLEEKCFLLGLNIQSLRCHHDDFIIELEKHDIKPKVIALTETWLTNTDTEPFKQCKRRKSDLKKDYNIANYHPLLSIPRDTGRKRGGLGFYVHESLTYKRIDYTSKIECAIIEICFNDNQYRNICLVYRPHINKMSHFLPEFENLLQFLRKLKYDTVLFGDFNIDSLKYSTDRINYDNVLSAYNFKRQNNEPTRVTATSSTCIDHLITSYQVENKTIKSTISDHYSVMGEIPGILTAPELNEIRTTNVRNLKKIKGENSLNFLFLLDQKLKKLDPNCGHYVQNISKTTMECVDRFAPLTTVKIKQYSNDWITNKVKNAITKRNKLFQLWVQSPTQNNKNIYKRQRNVVTSLIRNAKRECNYKKLGENPSSKTIYSTLKYQLAKDEHKNVIPDIEELNEYFTTIGQVLSSQVPGYDSSVTVPNFEKTMVLNYSDENEVAQIIKELKNKKSTGHDGLSNEMLKQCSPVIEKYLSEAFNNSIAKTQFPDFLKLAKVVPIFKKGDRTSPENYRPISLLCSISKVFEKLLYNRMVHFFVKNKLFATEQFGFRKKAPAFMQSAL